MAQQLLTYILSSDPRMEVVGAATDGECAIEAAQRLKPDVITMDIHMPRMNGYETTRRIMESNPVPIVIVSNSYFANDTDKTFRALAAGALAIVRKPRSPGSPEYREDADELLRTVKVMSEVKVVRRWPRRGLPEPVPQLVVAARSATTKTGLVAIGASTGGPAVLRDILAALPRGFSAPVMVVQHMTRGFMEGFVRWLGNSTVLPVHLAADGEPLVPGHIYFAPDDLHMLAGRDQRIHLSEAPPENGLRPAVSRLFRSVAEGFGPRAVGILLTGMGRDGAAELRLLREAGGVTAVQDRASSVVYGMPGEALMLDAADYVLSPERIAELLRRLAQ